MAHGPAPSCVNASTRRPESGSGVALTPTKRCSYSHGRGRSTRRRPRMSSPGAFKDVIKRSRTPAQALPVDAFLAQLDAFIAAHNPYRQNKVIPAIGDGHASLDVVK